MFLFQDDERVFVKPMTKSMLLKLRSNSLKLENNPIPFMKRMKKMDVHNLECARLDAQLFFFSLLHMIYLEIYQTF